MASFDLKLLLSCGVQWVLCKATRVKYTQTATTNVIHVTKDALPVPTNAITATTNALDNRCISCDNKCTAATKECTLWQQMHLMQQQNATSCDNKCTSCDNRMHFLCNSGQLHIYSMNNTWRQIFKASHIYAALIAQTANYSIWGYKRFKDRCRMMTLNCNL